MLFVTSTDEAVEYLTRTFGLTAEDAERVDAECMRMSVEGAYSYSGALSYWCGFIAAVQESLAAGPLSIGGSERDD